MSGFGRKCRPSTPAAGTCLLLDQCQLLFRVRSQVTVRPSAFPEEPPHGFADAVIELLETERFRLHVICLLLDPFDVISYFACWHFGLLLAAAVASCALSR